jgi:hypothetical protein
MLRFVTCLAVVLSVLAIAMPVSAGFITGVTATAGSTYGGNQASWMLYGAGGGMDETPVTKASLMDNDVNGGGMWMSDGAPAPENKWVKFDFAAPAALSEMVIWNYNQNNPAGTNLWERGLKNVLITYSTGADTSGVGHTLFNDALNCASGAAGIGYTNAIPMPGGSVADVAAVKIAYTTNWNGGDYYGLGEVGFTAATPEPGTIVLLTTGLFGLLAYAWRKRK